MKAIVVTEPGGPEKLELREVPDPALGEQQVLLDVRATALNRADLLQRRGFYPPPKGETDILGLECSGMVAAVGPGVAAVRPGERVMALLPGGGYAERVVIPARMAIPIPASMTFEQAAAVPEAFLTAREGLFTLGRLEPGQHVLIHAAAGGVGSAAVQLAHHHGGRVLATAGSNVKLACVRELGADVIINYKTQDFVEVVKRETNASGVDVVLDFIGGPYWEKHAACMAIGGRCVVIGVLGGTSATVSFVTLLAKRHQILGLVMRSRPVSDKIEITQRFIRESLPLFADGRLKPVIDTVLPLADARRAHELMESNANVGKIVLSVS
jgi:putative PIG3 family NAD(P)H quinone oxidoreductase